MPKEKKSLINPALLLHFNTKLVILSSSTKYTGNVLIQEYVYIQEYARNAQQAADKKLLLFLEITITIAAEMLTGSYLIKKQQQ